MNKQRHARILIVEDDYLVSEMIKGLLEETGYNVVGEACDGTEALDLVKSLQPDVVIMDIQMPGIDGIKAAEQIYACCPTPVVILTAYETPELIEAASRAGVNAYLVKPPSAHELERAITIAVARFQDMVELRRLNAELVARNEDLSTFAHTVAHDLKNPLALMVSVAETLEDDFDAMTVEELRRYLLTVAQSGRKMISIVDELLLLAEIRQQDVRLQPLNMALIVAGARERLEYLSDQTQATIIQPAHWPQALGHAPWIEEVWVNYLSNALKYGGQPPRIELGGAEQPDDMVRFWARDNGPGIPLEDQARLFVPFTQLSQTRLSGHGLGLSIVRRIIEKLGGQVGIDSQVGQGSMFWFSLPGPARPHTSTK